MDVLAARLEFPSDQVAVWQQTNQTSHRSPLDRSPAVPPTPGLRSARLHERDLAGGRDATRWIVRVACCASWFIAMC